MSDPAQVAAERINVDQCALGHPHLGLSKIKEIIRDAYAPQDVELQAYMEMLDEVQKATGAQNHVAAVFMVKAMAEALRQARELLRKIDGLVIDHYHNDLGDFAPEDCPLCEIRAPLEAQRKKEAPDA